MSKTLADIAAGPGSSPDWAVTIPHGEHATALTKNRRSIRRITGLKPRKR